MPEIIEKPFGCLIIFVTIAYKYVSIHFRWMLPEFLTQHTVSLVPCCILAGALAVRQEFPAEN